MTGRVIFVGNLPSDVMEREIKDLFRKCGRITEIDVKVPAHPPGFGFVEFEPARDAENAVRSRDGYDYAGNRIRVEVALGGTRRGHGNGGGGFQGRDGGGRGNEGRGYGGGMGGGISRRSKFRVIISGLPKSASWQDVKDHMRMAGEVTYAQVFTERGVSLGLVHFSSREEMKYAIRKLDDTEFTNPFETAYIRVMEDTGRNGHDRIQSQSPRRSVSPSSSRSPSHIQPNSKSRPACKTPSRSRSRSVLRSASSSPSEIDLQTTHGSGKATKRNGHGSSASASLSRSD